MNAKELKDVVYGLSDESEIKILNDNAPIKGAVPVKQVLKIEEDGKKTLVFVYESSHGKEGK